MSRPVWKISKQTFDESREDMTLFETERLSIRRFTADDAEGLYAYLRNPAVVAFEPYEVLTYEDSVSEAAARASDERFYAVILKSEGRLIGHLFATCQSENFATYIFGYVFHPAYHGKGYATEAARALLHYLKQHKKARRIVAKCDPLNIPSWKLLERLGLRREAHHRKEVFFRCDEQDTPIWKDTYVYAILSEEIEE